jgi:hypothetical protein
MNFEDLCCLELKKFIILFISSLASTGHQHEGSVYGARKEYDLAKMRLNLVCSQFGSLRESLSMPLDKLVKENEYEGEENKS